MLISDWSSDFCSSDLVTFDGWIASLNGGADSRRLKPVRDYANRLYQQAITEVLDGARDLEKTKVIPSRYVLAATEMIGQDQANDVSHIFLVKQRPGGEPRMTAFVEALAAEGTLSERVGRAITAKHAQTFEAGKGAEITRPD